MKCGLITNNDFINDLDMLVESLIKDQDNRNNRYSDSEIKLKWTNGIKKLRSSKYNQDDFNDAVKEYLADTSGNYSFGMFVEDGFDYLTQLNTLDLDSKEMFEVEEGGSKTDPLSTTLEQAEKNNIKGQFLNKYFPLASVSKLFFQKNFKNNIVKAIFINESGNRPTLVDSNEGLNEQINYYRESLKDQVYEAIKIINPDAANSFKMFESLDKALSWAEDFLAVKKEHITYEMIQKIPMIEQEGALSNRDITLLNGWQAWVILQNFDPLVKLTFGKAINIKNANQYDGIYEDKYSLNMGDANTTTWRDDNKDTDETEELGSLPILFLESLKVFNENGEETSQNLSFGDVKVAIGNIMKLFNSPIVGTTFGLDKRNEFVRVFGPVFGNKQVSDLYDTYIYNKNLNQVLAAAKEHPNTLFPMVFYLLKDNSRFGKGTKTRETINSLYYNLFDPSRENSLIQMNLNQHGFDPNRPTMYDFITTLVLNVENKPSIEYEYKFGEGIVIKSLVEKNSNSRLSARTRALDGKFNKLNPIGRYVDERTTEFKSFTVKDNLDGKSTDIPKGITITFENYTINVTPALDVNVFSTENGKLKQLAGSELETISENLIPFIQEVVDMPIVFQEDSGYTNNRLYSVYKDLGGDNISLLRLASHILYNHQVGRHMLNTTESSYNKDAEQYYTNTPPKRMYNQFQPELIPSADFNTIKTLSQAKDIVDGYSEINTVRDGAGKSISTLALSSLLSKVGEIWENHTKKAESPASEFSIFSMFEGFDLIRDYSGQGENKQGRSFTQAELAIASIIYDMYGDLETTSEDGKSSDKNGGTLRIMGPVVSDKSNLPKLKFNWDAQLPQKYWKDPKTPLKLRDLNNDDIKSIIKEEFGQYYKKVFDNIVNQYSIVNKYIIQACQNLGIENPTLFDYKDNFTNANNAYGNRAVEVLHEAIYLAQLAGENPEIIDQVGYIDNKGQLTNNPSIIHQMRLFGVADSSFITSIPTDETYEDFWRRKEIQLVTDFLQSGTLLKVKSGETERPGQAIATAIKFNKDFIRGENIAIAKIHNGDKSIRITQIRDLKEWYPYKKFIKEVGTENSLYDVDNPAFNLQATLDAINRRSIAWELREPENINQVTDKITKSGDIGLNTRTAVATLLGEAKRQYFIIMDKLNPQIAQNTERLEKSWNKKVEKDFTKNGKINKESLIEYIKLQIAYTGINNYFDEDPMVQYLADESGISNIIEGSNLESSDNYTLEINPEMLRHNLLDYFLGEEFIMATTGTYVSHPAKSNDIRLRESEQFGQAIKRYVSYTASKHREAAGNLNGIRNTLNVAIIEDDRDVVFNYNGNFDSGGTKPFDGASFYNPTMNYLDNNSLGGDAMGVDKKPFAHHMGDKSGIGFILKTAGFALTNDRIRDSNGFNARLNKQMLNIPWSQDMDWTKDFNGNRINYGPWFKYDPTTNKWFKYSHPTVENGITYADVEVVTLNGETINGTQVKHQELGKINTNWQLWNVFGGAYSGHINSDGNLTYLQDNTSVEMLVKAINNVGVKKYDKIFDQTGVDQVLKKAQIDIIATGGAVKYGGANINTKDAYFNDDYHLTYMTINSYDIGEQLDAEHNAEDESVSLMTQVINALGARGYSREQAQECYEALEAIAEVVNKDGLEGLEELNNSGNPELLKNAIAQIIYKTLTRVSSGDGNMLNALAASLTDIGNNKFDWSNIEGKFPISHPAIFQKMISSISSQLEKAIRLKFEGGMLVLNPSNRRFNIIDGHLSGYYDAHPEELQALENTNKQNPITDLSRIQIGHNYRTINPETGEVGPIINITTPASIYLLQPQLESGVMVYESFMDDESKPVGHDLSMCQIRFADTNGNYYSVWELDSVRRLWELHNTEDEEAKIQLRRQLQQDLNAISEGIESEVFVNGQRVRIDKSKTETKGYEAIMPMMYKTEFGLKEGDNIKSIKEDQVFFIKRALQNWKSNIEKTSLYDLELKTLNGNHIYLGLIPQVIDYGELTVVNIETEIDGDVVYRVTPEGERLYSIPYHLGENGRIIPDVQIYRTFDGQEVIYSNNLAHFLDEFNYSHIIFSSDSQGDKSKILKQLDESTNKTVRRKLDFITKIINNRYQSRIQAGNGIVKAALNSALGNSELADLLKEDTNITISDILEDEDLLNEAVNFIANDSEFINQKLSQFESDLNKKLPLEQLSQQNPMFRGMIKSGIETHTSFLSSLEMIVSRTPAQSQQSFMAMEIAAFGSESKNSAYVSRWQLWLQGSDYDIDKISILGLKFNHGKLKTWSPYFNMQSKNAFESSKKLPFPTNKELEVRQGEKRPYDVLQNNLAVTTGEFGETIIYTQNGNALVIFTNSETGDVYLNCSDDFSSFPPLEQYELLRNAISKIPQGARIRYNFNISERNLEALGIRNGINTKEYNINADFDEFNESIFTRESLNQDINVKRIAEDIIELAPNLGILIRTYNKLGYVPESVNPNIKKIVDYHNIFLKGKDRRDAAYNFVSIRTKDISKSPINQIQAQAAIDDQTAKVKDLLKKPEFQRLLAASTKADRGSVFSKFFMLTLTLAGKENVGIVASSLKNFEGVSQYIYQTLDEGSAEDQEDLVFDRVINGHRVQMIANSYTRNPDNIKNEDVLEALKTVDNDNDAFLVKSALLSLATDNAKDPVLAKLNSGPEMMSLFNSGVILGLSVEEVTKLTLSDTGILLSNLTKGNVFNGQRGFNRLTQAIQYLQRPPSVYFDDRQYRDISPLFQRLGLLQPGEVLTKTMLDNFLKNKNLREQLRRIFKFLSNPNSESSLLQFDREQFIKDQIALLKGTHEYRGFTKRREELLNQLLEKQKNLNDGEALTEEENSTLNKLNELKVNKAVVQEQIDDLYKYLDNEKSSPTNSEILDLIVRLEQMSSEDFTSEINKIRSNFYGNSYFVSNMDEIVNWIDYQNIVDNDLVEGMDGAKHKILTQIARLDEFSQEMSALRPLLALNQGIPNKMEDQFNFLSNFGSIITKRIGTIGQENVTKFYDVQDKLDELQQLNQQLYDQGLISIDVQKSPYYVDLNTFVSDPEYNKVVKDIYGKIKFAVNIFKVVDGVSHYHSYLRTANLAIQMGKNSSTAYRTALDINDRIVPKMNANSKAAEQIRRNILPTIYRRINQEYLRSRNIKYTIPQFEVKDGKVIMKEGTEPITLGYDKDNQKFKDWVQYIVFPELQSKYPSNKFLQYLGYRSYDFNPDHNQTINIAKIRQVNTKNPSDLVQFDLAKGDLDKLPAKVISQLFYYNIIAYNNQAGQLSLTDLFEDLVSANNFESIRQYNEFWSNHEDAIVKFGSDEELMTAIAPLMNIFEIKPSLKIPFIYVRNRENGIVSLYYKASSNNASSSVEGNDDFYDEFEGGPDFDEDGDGPKSDMSSILERAKYVLSGQVQTESQNEPSENSTEILEFGEFKMTNESKVKDIKIQYKGKEYTSDQVLKLAKDKGFNTKLSEIFIKKTKNKQKVYDLEVIKDTLDTIFNDQNNC